MKASDPRHGSYAGANAHWDAGAPICEPCKAAATRYQKQRNLKILQGKATIVPSDVVARKLRALVAIGYGYASIGRHIDSSREQVRTWVSGKHASISLANAERVNAAYNALHLTAPQPVGPAEKRAVTLACNVAKRNGWLTPWDWFDIDLGIEWPEVDLSLPHNIDNIDEVVVERIVGGDISLAKSANHAEKNAVVLRWRAGEQSLAELERLTGWATHRYGRIGA